MKDRYIFTHPLVSLVFCGFMEIYGNLSEVTNEHANKDQYGFHLMPVTYDRQTLMQLKIKKPTRKCKIGHTDKFQNSTAHDQKNNQEKKVWKK